MISLTDLYQKYRECSGVSTDTRKIGSEFGRRQHLYFSRRWFYGGITEPHVALLAPFLPSCASSSCWELSKARHPGPLLPIPSCEGFQDAGITKVPAKAPFARCDCLCRHALRAAIHQTALAQQLRGSLFPGTESVGSSIRP